MNPEGQPTPRHTPQRASALSAGPNVLPAQARDILDALDTAIIVATADRRITFANRASAAVLGREAASLAGRRLGEVWPEADSLPWTTPGSDLPSAAELREHQLELKGRPYTVRIARAGTDGYVLRIERTTDYAKVKHRFDRLLEGISDGVCIVDSGGRITYWNGAAERMTGVACREMRGRPVNEAFPKIIDSPLGDRFRETVRSGSPGELRGFSYGGDDSGRGAGIYDTTSHRLDGGGLLVIFREVSDKVHQEQELRSRSEEAEQLRRLARALAEVDDAGTLLKLLADSAIDQTDAVGSAVVEVRDGELTVTVAAGEHAPEPGSSLPIQDTLSGRAIMSRETVSAPDQSGLPDATRSSERGPVIVTPLVAHEQVLGAISTWRRAGESAFDGGDAERLRAIADHASLALWKLRLIDEAQAANRAKNDFMATISHELRTPLTALTGYGELLAEQIAGPLAPQQLEMVERMRAVTNHLTVIIDEILTFASIEAGRERLHTVEIDAAVLVEEAAAVVEPLALRKGISFDFTVAGDMRFSSDPDKVRQILVNLLGNAVKFTDSGVVHLECVTSDGTVRFSISDTGIGISPEEQERLFQPFTQITSGLTRRHGGTGLGLFISNRLAGLLGGRLELESAPGSGSTFTLVLPA